MILHIATTKLRKKLQLDDSWMSLALRGLFYYYVRMFLNSKSKIEELLAKADIKVNGGRPWDIQIHNDQTWARVVSQGSLGVGESYMDGWWDVERLDEFFFRIFRQNLDSKIGVSLPVIMEVVMSKMINLQKKSRAFQIGEKHYNTGNDLFELMLGKSLAYSCGYWSEGATNLDEAEFAKFDLICRKLGLKEGMTLLDIGCGWGTLMKYAVENYKVKAVGITVSKEQAEYARNICKGLPIEIRLGDYRDLNEKFDRIVSVGMFEHVGYKNYETYMKIAHKCLKDDGLFLLHTIASHRSNGINDPWIKKYIFPNSNLPSLKLITPALEKYFVMEDWQNFGADYDKTLMAWHKNVEDNWDTLKNTYSEKFHRMWNYYLLLCAGIFRARQFQLWQIVLSKKGILGGWKLIR